MGSYRRDLYGFPSPKDTTKRSLLLHGSLYRALKVHRRLCRVPQGEIPRPTGLTQRLSPLAPRVGGAPHGPKPPSRPHRPPHGHPQPGAAPQPVRTVLFPRDMEQKGGGRGLSLTASPHSVPPPPFCLRRLRSAVQRACARSGRAAPAQNGGALPPRPALIQRMRSACGIEGPLCCSAHARSASGGSGAGSSAHPQGKRRERGRWQRAGKCEGKGETWKEKRGKYGGKCGNVRENVKERGKYDGECEGKGEIWKDSGGNMGENEKI